MNNLFTSPHFPITISGELQYRDYHYDLEPQYAEGYEQFGRYSLWNAGVNQSFKNQSPNRVSKRRAKKKLGNQSRKKNYGN